MDRFATNEIRLFLSSTFRDMQAEREALLKRVFPPLRQAAAEAGIAWTEIDLRWGITDEEKLRGRVLPVCLQEIDRSNVLLILLGDHYGWRPGPADLPPEFYIDHPWLAASPGLSATEMEIRHALRPGSPRPAIFAFLKAEGPFPDDLDPDSRARLLSLKDDLRCRARLGELRLFEPYRDPDHLADHVRDALASLVGDRFPKDQPSDPFAQESAAHRQAAAQHRQSYVERTTLFSQIDRLLSRRAGRLVVTGPPGSGKTALLCNWLPYHLRTPPSTSWFLRLLRRPPPSPLWEFLHVGGASPRGATWGTLSYRLLSELKARFRLSSPIPTTLSQLRAALAVWLGLAAAKGPILLVLDDLNELLAPDSAAWLDALPNGVRVVASAAPSPVLDALVARGWPTLPLPPLSPAEREQIVTTYLGRFGKKLARPLLQTLQQTEAASNPLALHIVLDDARLFGTHEQLPNHLAASLRAASTGDLPSHLLRRLQADFDPPRPGLTAETLRLLAAARRGLRESELRALLAGTAEEQLPAVIWSPFFATLREFLSGFDSVWTFAYPGWSTWAARSDSERRRLVAYFDSRRTTARALDELPWLLIGVADWRRLANLFGDADFLPAAYRRAPHEVRGIASTLLEHIDPRELLAPVLQAARPPIRLACILAELLLSTGKAPAGAELAGCLQEWTRHAASPAERRDALGLLALVRQSEGNSAAALRLLEEQAELIAPDDEGPRAANWCNRAALAEQLGERERPLDWLTKAEALFSRLGDELGLADAMGNRAALLLRQGNETSASRLLRDLEARCRLTGNLAGLQKALGNRALLLAGRQPQKALRLHAEEELICRRLFDLPELAVSLTNQARLLTTLADYDQANDKARQAVETARQAGLPSAVGSALLTWAEVYFRAGIPRQGLQTLQEAADLAERHHLQGLRSRTAEAARREGY